MVRIMIFIDYLNFQLSTIRYYCDILGKPKTPNLDFIIFPRKLTELVPNSRLVKTYLFAPKPDDFLMQDKSLKATYDWINGKLRNLKYFEVIEGEYVSRHVNIKIPKDINNPNTYYKIEKGTDVNMSTWMLTKAFHNAYDLAIMVSGDSDYLPVIKQINNLGKNIIAVGVEGQNINKLRQYVDDNVLLDDVFFKTCLYKSVK
ncbi:MAG: NYN domain-containing protein [Phycisphaerae bacterium]|nr:NYN domain-containing protein [Phycisphaerae bacterium]MDD5239997.1 NYN domain-containing protein [Candidatus Nanoarchaeia archaeon]